MAVRIYELSKDIGMDNAELINLLKKRGYQVKSASSTIDNISAESLRSEFGNAGAASGDASSDSENDGSSDQPQSVAPKLPAGAVVRSKEDIERERAEREAQEQSNKAPRVVVPPRPAPAGNAPVVKAPPPLPKRPPVTARPTPPPPAAQGNAPRAVVPPRPAPASPVLRSDLPPAEKPRQPEARKPEAPVVKAPETAKAPEPVAPPANRPAPVSPPPARPQAPENRSAPAPMAPPRPAPQQGGGGNAPKAMTPPRPGGPQRMAPPPMQPPRPAATNAPKSLTPPPAVPPQGQPAAEKPAGRELRKLQVKTPIVVRDFAVLIGKKPFQLISELMELGIFASMNTAIEEEVATKIARSHGFELDIKHRGEAQPQQPVKAKKTEAEKEELEPRAPVVCILGHVDHGKTTLLDTIRKTNVVKGEAGGITQHVGAYQVEHNGKKITFIDTPGHAAFSNMRARGANVTDIAVLVVAADDGFMPQTDEALGHARKAGVPVVVAINKVDAPGSKPDRVRQQLMQRDLTPEELGGETLTAEVSALKGLGIEGLLDSILLQAEVTEGIEARVKGNAEAVVIEAQKELGRGSTASVIVTAGTLKPGAALVCGENYCRVRQLMDDKGNQIKSATPGTPVKITGWSGPPDAGDTCYEVKNEREAKTIASDNERERKQLEASQKDEGRASVEDLFAAIARTQKKTFKCIVKADVYGTAEALSAALLSIKSDKIDIDVIDMGVGDITKNDVVLADTADGASLVSFNVGMENGVQAVAKHHNIHIIRHNIIYELIDQVKAAMADLLDPEFRENKIGAAEVRATFPLGKGQVAGCMVTEGSIKRDHLARLFRKGNQISEAKIQTLKRFKDDVNEVRAGYECGLQLRDQDAYEMGDIIECYEILKIKPAL
ncbi:MAG: translation initiation factor IF-2 [Verrucomicrobiota bacterium JB022]|nr:translation initiation factor IF-2 [Verrucomicrobiota bacterium JB022]